jgi:energy-converting hydrogenase Eha subunit F
MQKVFQFVLATALYYLSMGLAQATPYEYPSVPLHDIPGALKEAYKHEKPNLGEIGRCVVAYDSSVAEDKMIFTCSIYVKMSAVAERKAMERCEGLRASKGIKGPCRVINE